MKRQKPPKPPKPRKPATGAALKEIREDLDLTQAELAALLDVAPGTISDWETGFTTLRRLRLERITRPLGVLPQVVDALVEAHQLLHRVTRTDLPIPVAHELQASTWASATAIFRTAHASILDAVLAAQAKVDRRAAARTWARLSAIADLDRLFLIERTPGVATWALVERLAAESIEEAPDRLDTALHLARLALRSAELAPVSDALRGCLLGYAHAHIGNAYRVAAEFRPAEAEFVIARKFWPEGATAPAGLLSEARLFDLEASLRRALRQFDKALALLDRALDLTVEGPAQGRLYLNQSAILEQQGNYQGSLEALRAAAPRIDDRAEPRLYGVLLFNLCANLVHLSRFEESCEILPKVRADLVARGKDFDLIRLLWLDGRIQQGLGNPKQAQDAFDQVRRRFTARNNSYDAALAGLDLAALYLETGRNAETRDLTRTMAAVFDALRIEREELAAVRLFVEAAERETATVELARRAAAAIRAIRRAREADESRV